MCDICFSARCIPGCPNFEPDDTVCRCSLCGEGISQGEELTLLDGKAYCSDCVVEATVTAGVCELPPIKLLRSKYRIGPLTARI